MENKFTSRCRSSSGRRVIKFDPKLIKQVSTVRPCKFAMQEKTQTLKSQIKQSDPDLNKIDLSKTYEKPKTAGQIIENLSRFIKRPSEDSQSKAKLKETIKNLQKEVKRLEKENFDLKEDILQLVKNGKEAKGVAKIFQACLENLIDLDELWFIVNPNGLDAIGVKEFSRGIRGIGVQMDEKKIEKLFLRLGLGDEVIARKNFIRQLQALKPSYSITLEDIRSPVMNINEKIKSLEVNIESIFDDLESKQPISFRSIYEKIQNLLVGIQPKDLEIFVRGVFGLEFILPCCEVKKVLNKLMSI